MIKRKIPGSATLNGLRLTCGQTENLEICKLTDLSKTQTDAGERMNLASFDEVDITDNLPDLIFAPITEGANISSIIDALKAAGVNTSSIIDALKAAGVNTSSIIDALKAALEAVGKKFLFKAEIFVENKETEIAVFR